MNESCRSEVDDLHTKCRQLEQNSTDLRTNLKTLHNRYNEQHAEMVVLKSKAYPLEHKLTALDSSVMSLLRHEKARDQDLIALYNITTHSRSQLGDLERKTSVELQYLEGRQNNTISVLHKYGTQINENSLQGISSIIELSEKTNIN